MPGPTAADDPVVPPPAPPVVPDPPDPIVPVVPPLEPLEPVKVPVPPVPPPVVPPPVVVDAGPPRPLEAGCLRPPQRWSLAGRSGAGRPRCCGSRPWTHRRSAAAPQPPAGHPSIALGSCLPPEDLPDQRSHPRPNRPKWLRRPGPTRLGSLVERDEAGIRSGPQNPSRGLSASPSEVPCPCAAAPASSRSCSPRCSLRRAAPRSRTPVRAAVSSAHRVAAPLVRATVWEPRGRHHRRRLRPRPAWCAAPGWHGRRWIDGRHHHVDRRGLGVQRQHEQRRGGPTACR